MQLDRGLGNLVPQAAIIWEAMTDRPASVRRVERRPGRNSGSDKPDFARFVTNVSILAFAREPSLKEIGTALSRPQRRRK